ncbi:Trehalose/maltose import ATP-binding protein MalK [uncultured archaeon]|nr:Trehalose/maltose import ATP-binding protein MalK [uncultured archaeon]
MALLELKGISKSYGEAKILEEIDLTVEKGEIMGLIGHTGSGKTTLLRLIDLLERPTSGSIVFDGVLVTDLPEKDKLKARRRMAMVFQKPVMFRASVRENVSFGLKMRGERKEEKVREALSAVGLLGYESRDASTLSGGEMQRTALARALVLEPELLLLDEPTANLDPKSAASIDRIIQETSAQNTTVIMATHNMRQCQRLAHRIAVLKDGRLAGLGRPEDIFSQKQLLEAFSEQEALP